ncbi:MAG: molybdenum cofactor biosynthesis protein MoaE [Chloroflexota bacterium]
MIELLYEALSPARCFDAVRRPGSGGIVTFVGSVRNESQGKSVERLEYEAYEPMAIESLQRIVDEAMSTWPVNSVAIQHRLGVLEVGEDAVAIAVSCPHRAEAFAACQFLIDRLKEVVPIWKKEHGEDGQVWVEGPRAAIPTSSSAPARD